MGNGQTNPFFVKCDDNNVYVLKGIHDDCNGVTLFNELVSYRLAKLLELPIPDAKLVKLNLSEITTSEDMELLNFIPGICFASIYTPGITRVSPPLLNSITNTEDIPGIILFDQLIINNDRTNNDGNLFFSKKDRKLMIIDHSHIFGGFQDWTCNQLDNLIKIPPTIIDNLNGKNYKYLVPFVFGNSPFYKIEEKICNINQEDLNRLFLDIPLEWNVSEQQIKSAKNLICHQIKEYKKILPQLKVVFTKWKGAC